MNIHQFVGGAAVACVLGATGVRHGDDLLALSVSKKRAAPPIRGEQSGMTHAECSHLVMLRFPDVKVAEAVTVPRAEKGTVRVPHCRVNGVIGTELHFELLLPDQWNHKLTMGGGGGFAGTIQNAVESSVNSGYATVGTDTGHKGGATDASWALNNLERQINFGYLAVHRTAEVAQAITASYYGSPSARNYFLGCSRGGGQALMEAQRYPDDFDGIVAGAPAFDWTGLAAQGIRNAQVAYPDSRHIARAPFSVEQLTFVEARVLETCDAIDGVKDGLMEDPRQCRFDLGSIATCAGDRPGPQCLTTAQHAVLKNLYAPTVNRDGVIYPGQPFGGEGESQGWKAWITGPNPALLLQRTPALRFAFGAAFFKFLVFGDAAWDYGTYDLNNLKKDTQLTATFMDATSTDLGAFKAKGRKLLMWHGWSDPALTALGSVRYYEQVEARDPGVRDYFRMFMMPGMLHCIGGPGPDTADWTETIDRWVESGTAPDRVIARKTRDGAVTRTRPLCVYPQRATYIGSGGIDQAENFVCRQP